MIHQVKEELENEFIEYYKKGLMSVSVTYTENIEEELEFKNKLWKSFQN